MMMTMPPDTAQNRPANAGPPEPDDKAVLPEQSQEDTDVGWGERPEPDDDERLYLERPPHWDLA
jgi:hypothetical protein